MKLAILFVTLTTYDNIFFLKTIDTVAISTDFRGTLRRWLVDIATLTRGTLRRLLVDIATLPRGTLRRLFVDIATLTRRYSDIVPSQVLGYGLFSFWEGLSQLRRSPVALATQLTGRRYCDEKVATGKKTLRYGNIHAYPWILPRFSRGKIDHMY